MPTKCPASCASHERNRVTGAELALSTQFKFFGSLKISGEMFSRRYELSRDSLESILGEIVCKFILLVFSGGDSLLFLFFHLFIYLFIDLFIFAFVYVTWIYIIIIHSKYFPVSDWLKPHAQFTITSCCSPNLERIFAILNQWRQKCSPSKIIGPMTSKWRQKCSPLQIIKQLTEKTWGQGCVIFFERKNKERNGETPLTRRKYFEWVIKQLLNSAFIGYEEFCRILHILLIQ